MKDNLRLSLTRVVLYSIAAKKLTAILEAWVFDRG
jgi:hypothetical protein